MGVVRCVMILALSSGSAKTGDVFKLSTNSSTILASFLFGGLSRYRPLISKAVIEGGEAHFHVGAGIVADSEPAAEWEETLHKAAGILLAARG